MTKQTPQLSWLWLAEVPRNAFPTPPPPGQTLPESLPHASIMRTNVKKTWPLTSRGSQSGGEDKAFSPAQLSSPARQWVQRLLLRTYYMWSLWTRGTQGLWERWALNWSWKTAGCGKSKFHRPELLINLLPLAMTSVNKKEIKFEHILTIVFQSLFVTAA